MQYWYSTTNILSSLKDKLAKAGLKPLTSVNSDNEPQNVLLIYSAPNQVLEQKRLEESTATTCNEIRAYYEELSLLSAKYKHISSSWRLNSLDSTSIIRLCNGENPQLDKSINFPSPKPLSSLLSLEIARKEPRIIDIYLDLELKSCLFGLEADSNYLQRLSQGSLIDLALMDWWEVNLDREASFEELKNNLNQLAQIQNNYEYLARENERLQKSLRKQRAKYALLVEENKELKESLSVQPISNKPEIEDHNVRGDHDEVVTEDSGTNMSEEKRQLEVITSDKEGLFPAVVRRLLKLASKKKQ
ncbi:hypothetical protein [Synechococcus sp. A15-24]|uniref:hypothetical protein n=1 Tax=Synechococcus sp. A15-24 TaxID=1050635 RepID=UPI001644BFBC|nr:hypothetical protein [Synechococcus sp. A15-24]QNJ28388.1 hypothetical protein SynA1524_00682 [Synechococcus sp. A15-24]